MISKLLDNKLWIWCKLEIPLYIIHLHTLTAAEIFGGVIRSDTTSGNITLNLPTASALYTQFGSSPPVGTYIDCKFENESINVITLASTDVNLIATGLISVFISALRAISIRFTVTSLSPVQLTMDGGSADYYAQITSGNIDSVKIGYNSPAQGAFSALSEAKNISSYTTSTTIPAANLINGVITLTPTSPSQVFTFDTASNIFIALGNPSVLTTTSVTLINLGNFTVTLAPGTNTTLAGMPTPIISPGQTFDLKFSFVQITPLLFSLIFYGGTIIGQNQVITSVFVSPEGSDTTGNGSLRSPFATVSHAISTITDASPSKVYTIILTGNITDSGSVYVSPNINLFAVSPGVQLNNSNNITADPNWATAVPGSSYAYWQNIAVYGNLDLDFSGFNNSIFPFFQFIQCYFVNTTFTLNGNPSSSGEPQTVTYFYQCYVNPSMMIDNAYIYGADNQWLDAANFGSGAATSCVQYYSVGDIFYSGLNFYDSNTSACNPVIQSTGTVYSTTGLMVDSGVGAVSTINVDIIGTLPETPLDFEIDDSAGGAIIANINGSGKISTITIADLSIGGAQVTLTLDGPPGTLNINAGTPTINYNYLSNAASIDTTQGFAVLPNGPLEFSWTGDGTLSSGAYTFFSGRGAHFTGGTDNIMLGKSATTNWVGTFMFSDSTNSSGGAYFPQGNNQIIFNGAGGFGIGNNSNTGTLGPQAGFHYANYNGNDGNFLFSGVGAVITANMNVSEINPYISTNTFAIQYKGSTGTAYTITMQSGGGTVPYLAGTQTWTGFNTFNNPLVTASTSQLFATTFQLYSTSGVIASADMLGGTIVANSASPASLQLPTFTNFDAALATFFGIAIPVNSLIYFTIENINAGAITLTSNTNFSILTQNGVPMWLGIY